MLSGQTVNQLKSTIQKGGLWYRCDTEWNGLDPSVDTFCLDEFRYYHQHLYGEVILRQETANFVFLVEFQWQSWNDLILNLRKDGFVMKSIHFDEEEFDVLSSLKKKSVEEVDKEVILMMNRYPPEANRRIQWVRSSDFQAASPSLTVALISDGEMITLQVTHF
ncbi:hypothetical protein L3V31_03825 [Vibrio sp. J1-1]|uniref:hypothetical protein n=1 Tax=Vibrio sp. J1-1 TaxID=2912251 RepID=UPI001F3870EA|nr:hypothetical protein [Vibrio sp. J1-1]MCF7480870.1 hypothetical protein [Vibrio sp. J1-1]